ncbi:MAG: dTDP-4-dehydrorhamnose reductase [Acidimicrobiales bacterium]|nr:dTDP-4-dehydrorhamnose reductase [Acidimicrobiales bacterium]
MDAGRNLSLRMRVLVTGAGGQLGQELVAVLSADGGGARGAEVVGADRTRLDVTDRAAVHEVLASLRPEVVVHAAAWTAVDDCETDPDRAFLVNGLGTRHLAEAARTVGAHVCYISTDYVFDGHSSRPYLEWDATNPLSVYGRSKLAGEAELGPEATVVRTSWVSGRHGSNLVKTVLRLLAEERPLRFVADQRSRPTFTAALAPVVRRLATERRPGLFHVTNQEDATRYDLARAVVALAGGDPGRVRPIATKEVVPAPPAARPAYSVLDNAALRLSGLPLLPPWQDSLEQLVRELL